MMTKRKNSKDLKPAGRPSTYTEEIALLICQRIAGGEYLKDICADPRMPGKTTVHRWMAVTPTFRAAYVRAREAQMEGWADDVLEIADDASGDYVERTAQDGSVERVYDPEVVQRAKLRIDTRKWLMSKLAPRYADKVNVDVSGSVDVSTLSDAELESRLKAGLAALGIEAAGPLLIVPPASAPPKPEPEPAAENPQDVVPEGGA